MRYLTCSRYWRCLCSFSCYCQVFSLSCHVGCPLWAEIIEFTEQVAKEPAANQSEYTIIDAMFSKGKPVKIFACGCCEEVLK